MNPLRILASFLLLHCVKVKELVLEAHYLLLSSKNRIGTNLSKSHLGKTQEANIPQT